VVVLSPTGREAHLFLQREAWKVAGVSSILGSSTIEHGLDRLGQRLRVDAPRLVRRLRGGAACDLFYLEFEREGRTESAALKVFPAHMAGSAGFEWAAMNVAGTTSIPTPEPVAFDQQGDWFGTPAIVMSLIPGAPVWRPADVREWTHQLAWTLVSIHQATPRDIPESMLRPPIWQHWTPTRLPEATARSVRLILEGLADQEWERGLCHGDFHPGNVLFADGAVTGVVDWVSARWGPTLSDLGRCRCALAVWAGGDAPEMLLEQYLAASTGSVAGLEYWDVLSGAVTIQTVNGQRDVPAGGQRKSPPRVVLEKHPL
jgi:prepilin-type processing-associated H-X9-DG protein